MQNLKMFGTCSLILFGIVLSASAEEGAIKWQEHMRLLSSNLVNAFPFLYSQVEFKKPQNKKVILETLKTLASAGHSLPVKSGEALIGAEPLIQSASFNIKGQLDEAVRLYEVGEFDSSQRKVHSAIQNCFACHTAHQIGPRFPTTNAEV